MSDSDIASYRSKITTSGSASYLLESQCKNSAPSAGAALDQYDGWPGYAAACAFAYKVTGNDAYRQKAIAWWQGSLDSRATWGDNAGCTVANLALEGSWRTTWDGNFPRPGVLAVVLGDTGYPMRSWPGYIAITYDWLYDAVGVTETLRSQTRQCVTGWLDNYRIRGYQNASPGTNYHAGFFVGKAIAAVAFNGDGYNGLYDNGDNHLFTQLVNEQFARDLVGKGMAPNGVLSGGDWGSWQYAPLSVMEYAIGTRIVVEAGVAQPQMQSWLRDLMLRQYHAQLPVIGREHYGLGDTGDSNLFHAISGVQVNALLAGPSSDAVAARGAFLKSALGVSSGSIYDAVAERRSVTPVDHRASLPSTWYVAPGTGTLFARSSWASNAFWSAFSAQPSISNLDHGHANVSQFLFTRGADGIIIDASRYGEAASRESNALWIEAPIFGPGSMYNGGQTPWGKGNLIWKRGTTDKTYAARADVLRAFDSNSDTTPVDLLFAQRDWVFLPEGELVAIDRVRSNTPMLTGVNFNTDTYATGGLSLVGDAYTGTVGSSAVAIHPVYLSGGTSSLRGPWAPDPTPPPSCSLSICNYNYFYCGYCDERRKKVDVYMVRNTNTSSTYIHVIDALASTEVPATTTSLSSIAGNSGVIGASVLRSGNQSFIVASSAPSGASGTSVSYTTPGGTSARHVVFDAPENTSGQSTVTAVTSGSNCVVSIVAGPGMPGRPLMFTIASAASGCTVAPLADTAPDTL